MSRHRVSPSAGFVNSSKLPRGPNGRALCRRCTTEVPKGRRSFCSDECVDQWRIRTDPAYVRAKVLERDKGICAICTKDCIAIETEIRDLQRERWHAEPDEKARINAEIREIRQREGAKRDTFWDADHIVPVVEGGGECGLDGYRTLCIPCHKAVTAALRTRLAKPKPKPARARKMYQLTLFNTGG